MPSITPQSTPQTIMITGLGTRGEGIGRVADGRVLFVDGALPGDQIEVNIPPVDPALSRKKNKLGAVSVFTMIEKSAQRIPSECTVKACGGCPLRAFERAAQRHQKRDGVLQILQRVGGFSEEQLSSFQEIETIIGEGWRYRHRVRLHVVDGEIGYFGRGTHTLAPVTTCLALWPELEHAVNEVTAYFQQEKNRSQLEGIAELSLAYSRLDEGALLGIRLHPNGRYNGDWELEQILSPRVKGVTVRRPQVRVNLAHFGADFLLYDHPKADVYPLFFSPIGFSQGNPEVNALLVDHVVGVIMCAAKKPKVLELHAGNGNFSMALANAGVRPATWESNPTSVALARQAAEEAHYWINIQRGQDTDAMTEIAALGFDATLLLDPPREGAKAVCTQLTRLSGKERPGRIVYVSCDPATLSRDISVLREAGYTLRDVRTFDMFPQTTHIETMVLLER